jgi:16S rRNA (uracil1498-N3)-methyltransferase
MSLPLFYAPGLEEGIVSPRLEEETARHMVQVLRMKAGEPLLLTNGRGRIGEATIDTVGKKTCTVTVTAIRSIERPSPRLAIAISLLKNPSRLEWFLEKAAELGITAIVPLLCKRTERQHFRKDRLEGILTSAMLQSGQSWRTELHEPMDPQQALLLPGYAKRYIAHCMDGEKQSLAAAVTREDSMILIGPEGDFTPDELLQMLSAGAIPVSLGQTRLRTETAGVYAAVVLTAGRG